MKRLQCPPSTSEDKNVCLWTEKHQPRTVADLEVAIHKQKVTEVRDWLSTQHTIGNRVLFLIGPPGCGKSTLLAVLCEKELGFRTIEWIPQPLLSFSEVTSLNNGSADFLDRVEYRSKLDAFEQFVRSLVAPPLPLQTSWNTTEGEQGRCHSRPAVAILDDLPLAYGHEQLSRLRRILCSLITTAAVPTVVLLTPDQHDVIGTLKGCKLIKCNPITELKIIKVLKHILSKEGLALDEESLKVLAKQANGDLGNAISTLQFYASTNRSMVGRQNGLPADAQRSKKTSKRGAKRARCSSKDGNPILPSIVRRDLLLTTFHGLGKLLYNKRLWGQEPTTESSQAWAPWTVRPPMDGFIPENVLDAAGLDSNVVSAFLHANLPLFIDDDAILDMAGCLAQLSAADSLLSAIGGRGRRTQNVLSSYGDDDSGEAPSLAEACSAITAARGICFWNSHPASRSFRQLLRPSVFEARRGMVKNLGMLRNHMRMVRVVEGGAETIESLTVLSTEILPCHFHLCSMPVVSYRGGELSRLLRQKPPVWWRWWNGEVHEVHEGIECTTGGHQRGTNDQGSYEIDATLRDGALINDDPIEEV
jgi:DNA polymerase III delta prime subunit